MKFPYVGLAAGLAIAAGATFASAADFGGIKDMGGVAIPVPAPAPVPTYDWDSDWYVGVSVGAVLSQSAKITDSDPYMPMKSAGDIATSPIYGLSFGRYITPSLRAEIAIDYTPEEKITRGGVLAYDNYQSAPNTTVGVGGTDTNKYTIYRQDTAELARTTGLFNVLYDINTGTRFTPYVGAGVGLTWRSIRRGYAEGTTCDVTTNPNFPPPVPTSCVATSLPNGGTPAVVGSNTTSRLDFAAALQAGVSYAFNDTVVWDNGWQMLWENGAIAQSEPTRFGVNRISYKDAVLQQFRSGIRLKFD